MKKSTKLKQQIKKLEQERDKNEFLMNQINSREVKEKHHEDCIDVYLQYREDVCLEISKLKEQLKEIFESEQPKKNHGLIPLLSIEETREWELSGVLNPTRKVTLIDGSHVYIDRVTGITCSLEEELQKEEERMEDYRKSLKIDFEIQDLIKDKKEED